MKYGISFVALALLSATTSGAVPVGDDEPQARTPQEILERAIEAMGGREALEAIETAMYEITFDESHGMIHFLRKPDHWLTIEILEVETHRAYNGEAAWMIAIGSDRMMVNVLPAQALAHPPVLALHRLALDLEPLLESAVVIERNVPHFDGLRTDIRFGAEDDPNTVVVGFDQAAGLPVGVRGRQLITYSDWVQRDGVVVPTTKTIWHPNGPTAQARITAHFNVVDDDVFRTPEAVRTILEHEVEMQAQRDRRQAIAEMDHEDVREAIARIAIKRMEFRGTRRHVALQREFDLLMSRLTKLADERDLPDGPKPADREIPERIRNMSDAEVREAIQAVSQQRMRARAIGDHEEQERLRQEFDWLMQRMRQGRQKQ